MGFFRQFEEFDPLTGTVPDHPFTHLPAIASRARKLLRSRTCDEIASAARNADFFIEEYFTDERESYIRRVLERGGWELGYLRPEFRNEAGVRELLENWPADADEPPPDIPTAENTSEVDALKECIGSYKLDDDPEFPKGCEFEYFAVLTLWLVADAMHWLKWTSDPKALAGKMQKALTPIPPGPFPEITASVNSSMQDAREHIPDLIDALQIAMRVGSKIGMTDISVQLTSAAPRVLCAMDAVCHAEHLHATEAQADELSNLRLQLHQLVQETDTLAEEKARKKISLAASKAGIKRHAENHAMKEQVFDWCAAHLHEYSSMDAAAEAIAGKLVSVAFRTARDWIGQYRKKIQSARRP